MRIIAGKHRGRKLAQFEVEGLRPTSEKAREALFDILRGDIVGANVLDMFCGSGGIGLEAISRGAASVTFNDSSKDSVRVLKKNLGRMGEDAKVYCLDFRALCKRVDSAYDLIYVDPPYGGGFEAEALELVSSQQLLTENGVAVLESDKPFETEIAGLVKYDERKYGVAYLNFFRRERPEEKEEARPEKPEKPKKSGKPAKGAKTE